MTRTRLTPLTTAATIAGVALVASWIAASGGVAGWEVTVGRWAYDLPNSITPVLEAVMQAGTRLAPVFVACVLVVAGWRWRAAGVVVAGLLTWLVTDVGKSLVDRARPDEATLGRAARDVVDGAGYPSSHTAIATALVVTLVLLGRPRRPIAVALGLVAVLTALARLHIAAHWPLDVVGGGAIGTLVAIVVSYAVGMAPGGAVARTGAEDEVVVATFNIRNGRAWDGWDSWVFRARSTATAARDMGADVLAIQEAYAFQNRFLQAALPGYERVGQGRGGTRGEWCAVFVRTDRLRVVDAATHWYGDTPDVPGTRLPDASFPRIGTHVRLELLDGGRRFEIVNTHLDERRPANRKRSVEQLVAWLDAASPRIVVGDLNATWKSEPELFGVLTESGLADAVPRGAPGTAHDFRGGTEHRRIDHIFVSEHWDVVEAKVVHDDRTRRLPSDHWPVLAHLRLRT